MSKAENRELSAIINKIVKSLTELKEQKLFFKEVTAKCPHGLYIYDLKIRMWKLMKEEALGSAWVPKEDGYYVIYFDNTACPACRRYDPEWFKFVKDKARSLSNFKFVIVLCEWFSRKCKSKIASNTFKHFNVHASPTTILLGVINKKIVYKEKYEGVLKYEELDKVVKDFDKRVHKALRGEPVEKPLKTEELPEEIAKIVVALLSGSIEEVKKYFTKKE